MNTHETEESEIPVGGANEAAAAPTPNGAERGKRNLTLLMLVLTAGTGAVALISKHGPQSAGAAPTPQAESTAKQTLPAELSAIRSSASANEIVAKFNFAPADVQVPLTDLKSDPFRSRPSTTQPLQLPDDAAESQRREQERQSALSGVQSLHLESIQRDESRRNCTINGMLYQEGQEVDGFVVEEIATTTVVVRKGVYRFELRVR